MREAVVRPATISGLLLFLAVMPAAFSAPLPASGADSDKALVPVVNLQNSPGETSRDFVIIPGRDPGDWSFTLEPYLWAMGAGGEVGVKGLPPTRIDYDAKTVLQHLDWGVMAKGELRKERWGLLADGLFAQLSASANPPAPVYRSTDVKLQQGMASLALSYRFLEDHRGFLDLYAGARYNYMGININAATDTNGINNLSEAAAERIFEAAGTRINERVDAFRAQYGAAIASRARSAVINAVTERALEKITGQASALGRPDPDRRDVIRILRNIRTNPGGYRESIAAITQARIEAAQARVAAAQARVAAAQARVAAAKTQLTSAIRNRVSQAQGNLASALAQGIDYRLPTSSDSSQQWVDPIVGLRGQVNITRWLFLAAQGDVGGFDAGSAIAWNVQASVGVNFTRNIFGELGYRYFYMDYVNGGALYQAGEFGSFLGIGVRF